MFVKTPVCLQPSGTGLPLWSLQLSQCVLTQDTLVLCCSAVIMSSSGTTHSFAVGIEFAYMPQGIVLGQV